VTKVKKRRNKVGEDKSKSVSLQCELKRRKALLGSNLPRDRFARYDGISRGCFQGSPVFFDMQDYPPMP
jgi:hypothetical protein